MSKPLLFSSVLASLIALGSSAAQAQNVPGYAINRFEPSDRGSQWFTLESLDYAGRIRPAFGVVGDFGYLPLQLYSADGRHERVVETQLAFHAGASLTLLDRFHLGVSLPLYAAQTGTTVVTRTDGTYQGASGGGLGDVRLAADARLLGDPTGAFRLGLGARVWLPTGSQADYTGDGEAAVSGLLNVAGDVSPFAYAARAGFLYRGLKETFGPSPIGNELVYGASLGVKMLQEKLLVGPELQGSYAVSETTNLFGSTAVGSKNPRPLYGILGAHYTAGDIRFGAGAGPGLSSATGTAAFRALLSFEWVPQESKPEPKPEPTPADRDGDGVVDADDACPDVKGVKTGNPKTNGCPPPPPDRDEDGIADADDACPDVKGVKTDDPKTNGCPLPVDRDGDGIIDRDDACPDVKGVKTDDPKTNGCPPDLDRDKDGIKNEEDACPEEPGAADPDPKKNGCPKAFIKAGQIVITDQVKFATGSAKIVPGKESQDVLEAVLNVLKTHPEVKKVRVEGHTDDKGAAQLNKTLSAERAASVAAWFVARGVDKARLASQGFGPEKPIADNKTEDGRKANRRVEFHIEP